MLVFLSFALLCATRILLAGIVSFQPLSSSLNLFISILHFSALVMSTLIDTEIGFILSSAVNRVWLVDYVKRMVINDIHI